MPHARRVAAEIDPSASAAEVADIIKDDHASTFVESLDEYRGAMDRARAFVVERELATPPEEDHLNVIETPSFIRHLIPFAAYYEPAKFDPMPVGTYIVTPPSSPEMMREHNRSSISNTSIHEAYPGHHLQLSAAITNPSLVRLFSGAPEFSEGWAFYCERMMKEAGFDDTPKGWYVVHTDAIWRATRIILDVQLHRGLIGFDDAVDRLVAETGFERPAALAEVKRYTSTPTYQLSYLFGRHMIEKLKAEVEARDGASSACDASTTRSSTAGRCRSATRAASSSRRTGDEAAADPARRSRPGVSPSAPARADPTPTPAPACPDAPPTSISAQATLEGAELATMRISGAVEGEFAIELYGDDAPLATANFVALARCGFYDGIKFHRVLAGFVIQAGDPQTRNNEATSRDRHRRARLRVRDRAAGRRPRLRPVLGVHGERHADERQPVLHRARRSRRGPAAAYTIFGQVVTGTDVVDAIAAVPVNDPRIGVPLTRSIIESITISARRRTLGITRANRQERKPLCFVKESKPRKPLSKENRRSILGCCSHQRFTTGRKAMGRLGLG